MNFYFFWTFKFNPKMSVDTICSPVLLKGVENFESRIWNQFAIGGYSKSVFIIIIITIQLRNVANIILGPLSINISLRSCILLILWIKQVRNEIVVHINFSIFIQFSLQNFGKLFLCYNIFR